MKDMPPKVHSVIETDKDHILRLLDYKPKIAF